jgi:RNA polymerase sigma factor (sigma-70 family)
MTDSQQLLADYVRNGSEAAFRELVSRYIDLVYSTALRLVQGDDHRAQDVAQIVFMDLARQASRLSDNPMLGGWLHRDTCFVAGKMMRGERRRVLRERQAVQMNEMNESTGGFERLAPLLDEAINELGDEDRKAILLRFYERHDLHSVGQALGSSENAAQKRVSRALEQLHGILTRQGLTLSAAALASGLATDAVTAAPAGLGAGIAAGALAGAASNAATAGLLKLMAMSKIKFGIVSVITIAGITAPLAIQHRSLVKLRQDNEDLRLKLVQLASPTAENEQRSNLLAQGSVQFGGGEPSSELLRLRGEVGRLRQVEREFQKLRQTAAQTTLGNDSTVSTAYATQPKEPEFFYVSGEVSVPGRFVWTNGMTLATAMELAHGPTDPTNTYAVQVKDSSGSSVSMNYQDATTSPATSAILEPGCRVVVHRLPPAEGTGP